MGIMLVLENFFNFSNPVVEVGSGSGLLNDITQVSAGNIHTCALQNNGKSRLLGGWGQWTIGEERHEYIVSTSECSDSKWIDL